MKSILSAVTLPIFAIRPHAPMSAFPTVTSIAQIISFPLFIALVFVVLSVTPVSAATVNSCVAIWSISEERNQ